MNMIAIFLKNGLFKMKDLTRVQELKMNDVTYVDTLKI